MALTKLTNPGAIGAASLQTTAELILSTDTYTSLVFDDTGEEWNLATYEEMYNTVDNGGLFPGDEKKSTWSFL